MNQSARVANASESIYLLFLDQEQPLLLEELLEQEKREQERQAASVMPNEMAGNVQSNSQGLLSDQDFERLRADVMNSAPQSISNQGMLPMQQQPQPQQPMQQMQNQQPNANQFVQQQQHVANRQQFAPRGVGQPQWRPPMHQQQQQQQQMNANVGPIMNVVPTNDPPNLVKKEG